MLLKSAVIILEHNASVSENCEKCMQSLPATRSRMQVHWRKTYSKPFNASQFPNVLTE